MNALTKLLLSLTLIATTSLKAQTGEHLLDGTWYMVNQTNNSAFKLSDEINLDPPSTSHDASKPKEEPFVERWTFDGTYAYVQRLSSIVEVTTHELTTKQLQLNLPTPQSYGIVYRSADSLVLSVNREELFEGKYKDTLYLKKRAIEMPGLEKIRSYVQQESLYDFQLHGVYQWVIERDKFEDLSKVLEENEVVTLSLRFYPDNTVLFMMSVIQKDALDADRCKECYKLNGDVFPYPFGLHKLQKKGDSFYFQPEYTWMGDGFRSEYKKIDKSDQIRFELALNDGAITLTTDSEFDLLEDTEQSFSFVPFRKMNYYISQD